MPIFCMCSATVLAKAPNGDIPDSPLQAILPEYAMRCIQTGMMQFIQDPEVSVRFRHYPDVDVFACPKCGARVAKSR